MKFNKNPNFEDKKKHIFVPFSSKSEQNYPQKLSTFTQNPFTRVTTAIHQEVLPTMTSLSLQDIAKLNG